MATITTTPRILRGGIVVLSPDKQTLQRIIALQYNPDSLTRTLQPQVFSSQEGERSESVRLKGPPVETIKFEAEVDLADQLETPGTAQAMVANGLHPYLAALELLLYPTREQLLANNALSKSGALEIIPAEAPLTFFVWSPSRVMPVRITDLSVTEESFDPNLNPLRARLSLTLRVLNVNDLGFDGKGGEVYLEYLRERQRLAGLLPQGDFTPLGIRRI